VLATNVRDLDGTLSDWQVSGVVDMLLEDIKIETAVSDLKNLPPGVTVDIFKKYDSKGGVVWNARADENSGIGQGEASVAIPK